MKNKIKSLLRKLSWIKIYFSPFKKPKLKFYFGKIKCGTPYFYPRKWIKNENLDGLTAVPKKIGFDLVGLGYKLKFDEFRFEYGPLLSFVFFKLQFCILVKVSDPDMYWECWLNYLDTDKKLTIKDRISNARHDHPCIWTRHKKNKEKEQIDYWERVLKKKYL